MRYIGCDCSTFRIEVGSVKEVKPDLDLIFNKNEFVSPFRYLRPLRRYSLFTGEGVCSIVEMVGRKDMAFLNIEPSPQDLHNSNIIIFPTARRVPKAELQEWQFGN